MLSTLYLFTMLAALLLAMWEAKLIKANRPIRHGLWLSILAFGGGTLAAIVVGPWWALVALPGMAGLFSMWFRSSLNSLRGLLPGYMGPNPSDSTTDRSQYDLLCWRIALHLKCQPVTVALWAELVTFLIITITFTLLH